MKIIHTSDWHIGHSFFDFERYEEHARALAQLSDIVAAEQPDALLVSGDIFHSYTPSSRARRLFVDAIEEIHQRSTRTHIIVTAGNHDNAAYHEVFSTPWRKAGVHTIGLYTGEVDSLIIEIPGVGYVGAVPYVPARRMNGLYERVMARIAELNTAALPVVLMGHLAVSGCQSTGHDDDGATIGNIDCCTPDILSTGYDYVALGHIHKPQTFEGMSVRYSGSLLPVSFDETWLHTVSIVDIPTHGADISIREAVIEPMYDVLTIEGAWTEVYEKLREIDVRRNCYIRLKVSQEDALPYNADFFARQECDGVHKRFCTMQYEHVARRSEYKPVNTMDIDAFSAATPLEIATRYADMRGFVFDNDMAAMLESVLDKIEQEDRNQ
ncbi:MAG: exonuclease SbcCD subunit D [Muribaculaceae bacterium]|nr:exonuclease SbcCD subunit D [Muribaculaceae bacterium]